MRLRMKNFNIMGVHWKIRFFEGVHEKPEKGELGQFANLGEGGLAKKEG